MAVGVMLCHMNISILTMSLPSDLSGPFPALPLSKMKRMDQPHSNMLAHVSMRNRLVCSFHLISYHLRIKMSLPNDPLHILPGLPLQTTELGIATLH